MKEEKTVRYEKPTLSPYGLLGVARGDIDPEESSGGDIPEDCDSSFDE